MKEFHDRVAVITGGASGIGLALAERFAAEGMKLAIADIHQPSLDEAAAKLRASGATVLAERVDVSDAAAVEAFAEAVYRGYGAVHVLCNNAGVTNPARQAWKMSLDRWNWVLGVNLWGVIHGVNAFVPKMIAAGEEGHVVNTGSVAGLMAGGTGSGVAYATSKHAVVALSECLYSELKSSGSALSASVLCPGTVDTDILAHAARDDPRRPGAAPTRLAEIHRDALAASWVAGEVIAAIAEDRFYIVASQPAWLEAIRDRHARIERGDNPGLPPANGRQQ